MTKRLELDPEFVIEAIVNKLRKENPDALKGVKSVEFKIEKAGWFSDQVKLYLNCE